MAGGPNLVQALAVPYTACYSHRMDIAWQTQPERHLRPGDAAPNVRVLDLQGRPTWLREVWAEGPVLLTFLRHFG